jgi:hypothetical protein
MAFLEVAVLPARGIQALFSIIVLGLTAYGTSLDLPALKLSLSPFSR